MIIIPHDPFIPSPAPDHHAASAARWRHARHRHIRTCLSRWQAVAGRRSRLRACEEWASTMCINVRVSVVLYWSSGTVFRFWRRLSRQKVGVHRAELAAFSTWRRHAEEKLLPARRIQSWKSLVLVVRRWRLRALWSTASAQLSSSHLKRLGLQRAIANLVHRVMHAVNMTAAISHYRREGRRRGLAALVFSVVRARNSMVLQTVAGGVALRRAMASWSCMYAVLRHASIVLDEATLAHRRILLRQRIVVWRRALMSWSASLQVCAALLCALWASEKMATWAQLSFLHWSIVQRFRPPQCPACALIRHPTLRTDRLIEGSQGLGLQSKPPAPRPLLVETQIPSKEPLDHFYSLPKLSATILPCRHHCERMLLLSPL